MTPLPDLITAQLDLDLLAIQVQASRRAGLLPVADYASWLIFKRDREKQFRQWLQAEVVGGGWGEGVRGRRGEGVVMAASLV